MSQGGILAALRVVGVLALGVALASTLALLGFVAVLSDPRFAGQQWNQSQGQWWFAMNAVVAATHLVWIIAWLVLAPAGRVRFVNAVLLIPGAAVMAYVAIAAGCDVAANIPPGSSGNDNAAARSSIVGTCVVLIVLAISAVTVVLLRRSGSGAEPASAESTAG